MSVVLRVPCDGCAHLAVCSIAPGLARQLDPYRAPRLFDTHEAIEVDATIDVCCRHFMARAELSERLAKYAFPIPGPIGPLAPAVIEPVIEPVIGNDLESPTVSDGLVLESDARAWREAIADPETSEALDEGLADVAAGRTAPLTVDRLTELGHAPTSPKGLALVTCPGCKGQFAKGPGIVIHRKHCGKLQAMGGFQGVIDAAVARDEQAVREVAAASREREATAGALHEAFVDKRAAAARERANANMDRRRGARA